MTATRNPDKTREALLQAAFEEIYRHGFQAASLDRILARTGVTKGALYHHFKNKLELGYAVVDDLIGPMMYEAWITPLTSSEDPLEAIKAMLRGAPEQRGEQAFTCGCPLNNLAQEMSPLDEGFRQRIQSALRSWRQGVGQALRRGQRAGTVNPSVDADRAATFLVAAMEGTIGLAKNSQSESVFDDSVYGFELFLDSLRPVETPVS